VAKKLGFFFFFFFAVVGFELRTLYLLLKFEGELSVPFDLILLLPTMLLHHTVLVSKSKESVLQVLPTHPAQGWLSFATLT
jgi:hypothetical protein